VRAATSRLTTAVAPRVRDIQGRMDVELGPMLGLPEFHQHDRLCALQRLGLRLLVHREEHYIRPRATYKPTASRMCTTRADPAKLETLRTKRLQPDRPP
jgi:hypothetical protein